MEAPWRDEAVGWERAGDLGPAFIHCHREDRTSNARWLCCAHGDWTPGVVGTERNLKGHLHCSMQPWCLTHSGDSVALAGALTSPSLLAQEKRSPAEEGPAGDVSASVSGGWEPDWTLEK